MTTPKSETPRTDAAVGSIPLNRNSQPWYQCVKADFARQLERELAEARKEADQNLNFFKEAREKLTKAELDCQALQDSVEELQTQQPKGGDAVEHTRRPEQSRNDQPGECASGLDTQPSKTVSEWDAEISRMHHLRPNHAAWEGLAREIFADLERSENEKAEATSNWNETDARLAECRERLRLSESSLTKLTEIAEGLAVEPDDCEDFGAYMLNRETVLAAWREYHDSTKGSQQ